MDEERIRQRIVRTLGRVDSVLDIGCGSGDLVRFLARNVCKEALGIDLKATEFHERIEGDRSAGCVKGDASFMKPLADDRFDAVVVVRTLHELSDPGKALSEAIRVLKRGGMIFIADFAKGHEGERLWGERFYSPEQVREMLSEAGFEEVNVKEVPDERFIFASARKPMEKRPDFIEG